MKTFKLSYQSISAAKLIILATIAMMIGSCGTSSVYITVTRPAEINIKGYEKIAVGDILGAYGGTNRASNAVSSALTNILLGSGRFEVLDRANLNKIMAEQSLSDVGIIGESSAAALGEIIGTAALVFGNIQTNDYQENVTVGKSYVTKKGVRHQTHTRKGTYRVTVNLRIVDVETSRILAAKTISASKTERKTADKRTPALINKGPLFDQCVKDISQQFIRMIAPYDVKVRAAFMTDDLLPETDLAVNMFKVGEWEDGMVSLRAAVEKTGLEAKVQAKAYYNLGLAETYQGAFEDAIIHLKKALGLDPSSKRIQKAIITAKKEQESAEKLAEQL